MFLDFTALILFCCLFRIMATTGVKCPKCRTIKVPAFDTHLDCFFCKSKDKMCIPGACRYGYKRQSSALLRGIEYLPSENVLCRRRQERTKKSKMRPDVSQNLCMNCGHNSLLCERCPYCFMVAVIIFERAACHQIRLNICINVVYCSQRICRRLRNKLGKVVVFAK